MKRYWLSMMIILLAVIGISTFYLAGRQNHLPKYRLETIQGDPKEAEVVALTGSYYGNMRSEPLRVSSAGSEYGGKYHTFRDSLNGGRYWFSGTEGFKELIVDHKSFMRGKTNPWGFYRDGERVIYAEADIIGKSIEALRIRLRIHMLDEKTDQSVKYESTIEAAGGRFTLNIEEVQFLDNRIYILGSKYYYGISPTEYELFVINADDGTLIRNERFENLDSPKEGFQNQVNFFKQDISTSSEYAIFEVGSAKVTKNGNGMIQDSQLQSTQLFSYSYRTEELSKLPDEFFQLQEDVYSAKSLQNDIYYKGRYDSDSLNLSKFNISTQSKEINYASVSASQLDGDKITAVQISKGRVYVLVMKDEKSKVAVFDLNDGKLLFTGKPAVVGNEEHAEDKLNRLHLLNLDIENHFNG